MHWATNKIKTEKSCKDSIQSALILSCSGPNKDESQSEVIVGFKKCNVVLYIL